jgi:hypothetical protein
VQYFHWLKYLCRILYHNFCNEIFEWKKTDIIRELDSCKDMQSEQE